MESCSNQKSVKQNKMYIFRFYILQSSHPLPRWQLCTLLAFSQPASWGSHLECFYNSLEGVPTYAEHLLLFLHSAVQHIPNILNWVEVGWLWRPGHLMQHSIILLIGQIALAHPGDVLGHCTVEKQMIVPLSPNQMGWCIAVVAMLVKCALNSK